MLCFLLGRVIFAQQRGGAHDAAAGGASAIWLIAGIAAAGGASAIWLIAGMMSSQFPPHFW